MSVISLIRVPTIKDLPSFMNARAIRRVGGFADAVSLVVSSRNLTPSLGHRLNQVSIHKIEVEVFF